MKNRYLIDKMPYSTYLRMEMERMVAYRRHETTLPPRNQSEPGKVSQFHMKEIQRCRICTNRYDPIFRRTSFDRKLYGLDKSKLTLFDDPNSSQDFLIKNPGIERVVQINNEGLVCLEGLCDPCVEGAMEGLIEARRKAEAVAKKENELLFEQTSSFLYKSVLVCAAIVVIFTLSPIFGLILLSLPLILVYKTYKHH